MLFRCSHVWSSGQDQVLSIKKELLLIVPSLKIWLDVENLTNIAGLEDNITNIDFVVMFLSKGYFKSWNCLREIRQATFVHALSTGALDKSSSVAAASVAKRRNAMSIQAGGSSIILVRETDEQNHGGAPLKHFLAECPEKIGCSDHTKAFDSSCQQCCSCPIDIQAALRAHASSVGAIDWIRFTDFKMISLKQIVQQMLVASQPLHIPGELSSMPLAMPMQPQPHVLMHRGCNLSDALPELLQQAAPGIIIEFLDGSEHQIKDHSAGEATVMLVVVHDRCFEDHNLVASIKAALECKMAVVLLHEADTDHKGCVFNEIIEQCPPELMGIAGFGGAKIFDNIAVQWSRGPHQAVSILLLAKSLGATVVGQQVLCAGVKPFCKRIALALSPWHADEGSSPSGTELSGGTELDDNLALQSWDVFKGADQGGAGAGTAISLNPLHAAVGVSEKRNHESVGATTAARAADGRAV